MDGQDLRKLVESEGAAPVADKICEALWDERNTLGPRDFHVRELWEAFVGPCDETLPSAIGNRHAVTASYIGRPLVEQMHSTAFNLVTGNVIAAAVQAEYDLRSRESVLDKLVTPETSSMRTERMLGFQAVDGPEIVVEGDEYPETGFKDKGTQAPEPDKKGRAISVTEETVFFDQTNQILGRARSLTKKMRLDREKDGMRRIQDLSGYSVYYPLVAQVPTQTGLYRAAGSVGTEWYNRTANQTATNALVDWTDIDVAFTLFNAMTDEANDEIVIAPNVLLVPYALYAVALRITSVMQLVDNAASANQMVTPEVLSKLNQGIGIMPMWSVFMNDTTTWYLGDFSSQFIERILFPIQTIELPPNKRSDIVASFAVRRKSQVEATDDKFVVKCPGT